MSLAVQQEAKDDDDSHGYAEDEQHEPDATLGLAASVRAAPGGCGWSVLLGSCFCGSFCRRFEDLSRLRRTRKPSMSSSRLFRPCHESPLSAPRGSTRSNRFFRELVPRADQSAGRGMTPQDRPLRSRWLGPTRGEREADREAGTAGKVWVSSVPDRRRGPIERGEAGGERRSPATSRSAARAGLGQGVPRSERAR